MDVRVSARPVAKKNGQACTQKHVESFERAWEGVLELHLGGEQANGAHAKDFVQHIRQICRP